MPAPRAAFDALYEQHLPSVHAYLLARTRDREVAQDLAQETFLRAWRNIAELGAFEVGRQRAWLVAVARNLVIDRSRRTRTERTVVERVGRLAGSVDAPDPAGQAELERDVAAVDHAIAALPEEQRILLSLQVMGGMTSGEIGEMLGEPAGTVRYRLNQVRRQLREALEPAEGRT
ncbi:MAG: RNA polymerase sigma factor [Candidatus Dormibacteraeota bacterium]|nr:RNA polymerase sigma factor [Candidatus Dormibacteraeota bacterium]